MLGGDLVLGHEGDGLLGLVEACCSCSCGTSKGPTVLRSGERRGGDESVFMISSVLPPQSDQIRTAPFETLTTQTSADFKSLRRRRSGTAASRLRSSLLIIDPVAAAATLASDAPTHFPFV